MRIWLTIFLWTAALGSPLAGAAEGPENESRGSQIAPVPPQIETAAAAGGADADGAADAAADTKRDTGFDTQSGSEADADPDTRTDADVASDTNADADTSSDTDADTDSKADPDSPSEAIAAATFASAATPSAAPDPRLSFICRSSAGTRGEAAVDALARARAGPLLLIAGAGTSTGLRTPYRMSALVGLEAGSEFLSGSLLLRLLPAQSGAALAAAHGELRWSSAPWALALSMDGAHLALDPLRGPRLQPGLTLSAASLGLEVQRSLGEAAALWVRGALAASALALDRPGVPRDVWQQPGLRALQWPQRASGGAGLRLERQGGAASLGFAVELPADPVGAAAELSLSLEHGAAAGAFTLDLTAGRLFPSGLWLGRAALEIRVAGPG